LLLATVAFGDPPTTVQPDDPHYDLEQLYFHRKFTEGLAQTEAKLASNPDDPALYWHKSRFMYEIGERFDHDDPSVDKVGFYKAMKASAEAGLKVAPDDPHLHFALAVSAGRLGTTRGVMASLFLAKTVERGFLAPAEHPTFNYASLGGYEQLPCDAYHGLGIFYRLVPDWWVVKVLSGTRGDLTKAVHYNQLSTECKPQSVQNHKELMVSQMCLAEKTDDPAMMQEAIVTGKKALALPTRGAVVAIDKRHIQTLLDDPSLACGYSRDGQQELDEKKLKKEAG
ncbi:MAG: hypothetical protein AAF211_28455, partial [Myxococcota bacterium]